MLTVGLAAALPQLALLLSMRGVLVGALVVLHVIVCFFLIGVVLLQSGRAADLASAFGGGVSQANMAPMSTETILTRATKYSAFTFMATSLALALFAASAPRSALDVVPDEPPAQSMVPGEATPAPMDTAPAASTPAAPSTPAPGTPSPTGGAATDASTDEDVDG